MKGLLLLNQRCFQPLLTFSQEKLLNSSLDIVYSSGIDRVRCDSIDVVANENAPGPGTIIISACIWIGYGGYSTHELKTVLGSDAVNIQAGKRKVPECVRIYRGALMFVQRYRYSQKAGCLPESKRLVCEQCFGICPPVADDFLM